ncbi:hypothetical protein BH09BAC1_BH09BAC1_19080 [soil metagenome]
MYSYNTARFCHGILTFMPPILPMNTLRLAITAVLLSFFALQASALEVQVRHCRFYAPEIGPYVETDLLVIGNSIKYMPVADGKFRGAVEVTLIYKQAGVVKAYDKYVLNSVDIADTSNITVGIVDKKRFLLPNGNYVLEATFKDLNSGQEQMHNEDLVISYEYEKLQLSDVSLVDEYHQSEEHNIYVKSGVFMSPYVVNFYHNEVNRLPFYTELYNPGVLPVEESLLVSYAIYKQGKTTPEDKLYVTKKVKAATVTPIFAEFDITNLTSGNYEILVEVRNRKNEVVASRTAFFQRMKFISAVSVDSVRNIQTGGTFAELFTKEELEYQLLSMLPVATAAEVVAIKNIIKNGDMDLMRRVFLNFWLARNDVDPLTAWTMHADLIKSVNLSFGTNSLYGFQTDRGRVYLQYGPPNQRQVADREPGTLPYEVWHYYEKIGRQSNVKFIFYNEDLVTNHYTLLHSTAVNEIKNEQWLQVIQNTFTGGAGPANQGNSQDHFGGRSKERFNE